MTITEFQEKVKKFQSETTEKLDKLLGVTITLKALDIKRHMEISDSLLDAARSHGKTISDLQSIVNVK